MGIPVITREYTPRSCRNSRNPMRLPPQLAGRGKSHGVSRVAAGTWGIFSSYDVDAHSKRELFSEVRNLSRYEGQLPNPETEPRSHSLKADSLPSEPPGKSFLSSLVHQFQNVCHICPLLLLLFSHSTVTVRLCNPMDLQHGRLSQSFTASRGLLTLLSIESVMLSNHLVLCHPLLLPSIFPSIRGFSNDLAFHIRWPKYFFLSSFCHLFQMLFLLP